MKVNRKTLTDLDACVDGMEWFDNQDDKELSALVKSAIKEGGESLNYAGWGLCSVMTEAQRNAGADGPAEEIEALPPVTPPGTPPGPPPGPPPGTKCLPNYSEKV